MNFSKVKAVLLGLAVSFSTQSYAGLIGLENSNQDEYDALVSTLTSLGHTVTNVLDSNLDLVISSAGNDTNAVQDVPYLQISDWGSDNINNTWSTHQQGDVVEINLTGNHDVLYGLENTWNSFGFWHYGFTNSFLGSATSVPGIANATVNNTTYQNTLAVTQDNIFIGWNVYGPAASSNDIKLLSNAIEFLTTGAVSKNTSVTEPTTVAVLSLALFGLAASRRRVK